MQHILLFYHLKLKEAGSMELFNQSCAELPPTALSVSGAIRPECLDLSNDDSSTRPRKRFDDFIWRIAESFEKRAKYVMTRDEEIAKHEKSLRQETDLRVETALLEEVSTCEKKISGCKRRLKEGIADSEEKNIVRFKLRMARKILKKAQDKLRNVYGEASSESD